MSGKVTGWVLENSPTTGAARLVLIVLADHANSDGGNAWPSVPTIARQARCSESTAHRVLRGLESSGQIVREGTGPKGCVRYRVAMTPPMVGGVPGSEGSDLMPATPPMVGPEPSVEPTAIVVATETLAESEASNDHLGAQLVTREEKAEKGDVWPPPTKLFGKWAPASLVADAISALAHYCEQTGQQVKPYTARGRPTDSLTRIMRAMDDYPEVRVVYRRMIDHTLASRWWGQDEPHVGVIFGPGAVQQSIQRAHRRPLPGAGMKLTPTGQALRALRLAASESVG